MNRPLPERTQITPADAGSINLRHAPDPCTPCSPDFSHCSLTRPPAPTCRPPRAAAGPADLYVSPQGNDAWSGKLPDPNAGKTDGPLATLDGARLAVRKLRQADAKRDRPITVLFRAGTYVLTSPIVSPRRMRARKSRRSSTRPSRGRRRSSAAACGSRGGRWCGRPLAGDAAGREGRQVGLRAALRGRPPADAAAAAEGGVLPDRGTRAAGGEARRRRQARRGRRPLPLSAGVDQEGLAQPRRRRGDQLPQLVHVDAADRFRRCGEGSRLLHRPHRQLGAVFPAQRGDALPRR